MLPAVQVVQPVAPAMLTVPFKQVRQEPAEAALYLPASHVVQDEDAAVEYAPASQAVQAPLSDKAEILPASQMSQYSEAARL